MNKVAVVVSDIESQYNMKFTKPVVVKFDINSARLGGQAVFANNLVRLNPVYLAKYQDEYINSTVIHEVAHLGVHEVYQIGQGRKVDGHGPEWKQMMRNLGADPKRCHTYQPDPGQGRSRQKYEYKCSNCSAPVMVGPVVHKNLMDGQRYNTRCCGRTALVIPVTQRLIDPMNIDKKPVIDIPSLVRVMKTESKISKCYDLYVRYHHLNYTRQEWINLFVSQADCTPAGASTYFGTCVNRFKNS
jgi:SprT protein